MQQSALAPAFPGDVQTLVARALEQEQRNGVLAWQVAGRRERLDFHQAALLDKRLAQSVVDAVARDLIDVF